MGTEKDGRCSCAKGAEGRTSRGGRIQATSFLPGELEEHYNDHAGDFPGDPDPYEYEAMARKFFDKPVTGDILWFEDIDGVLYKYDKKRGEFGICGPDGLIITYFKPETGLKYWEKQMVLYAI